MYEKDSRKWAIEIFGNCDLGDVRRKDRLIDYAARQAYDPLASTNAACGGDEAAAEGAYRFLRNQSINARDIDDGVCETIAYECSKLECVLIIQDTTTIAVKSQQVAQREDWGSGDGFQIHSSLAVDALTGAPIGLIDQERWMRKKKRPGRETRHKRNYQEKESYKWEAANQRLMSRTVSQDNLITIADREADIFEYLEFLTDNRQRFIQRASTNRPVCGSHKKLRDVIAKGIKLGSKHVEIKQRGPIMTGHVRNRRPGRKKRVANVEIRIATVKLKRPERHSPETSSSIEVNAIWVHETRPPKDTKALDWLLLTNEPVATREDAEKIIRYYELRWLIEEFHKAWKTGCRIETRALKEKDNLERLYAVTAPIAVRLLQLRCLQDHNPKATCEEILTRDEWQCLYATTKPGNKIPKSAPTIEWAVHAIARLVGWRDSKRTGRIGWDTMWKGWSQFQGYLIGWRAAISLVTS